MWVAGCCELAELAVGRGDARLRTVCPAAEDCGAVAGARPRATARGRRGAGTIRAKGGRARAPWLRGRRRRPFHRTSTAHGQTPFGVLRPAVLLAPAAHYGPTGDLRTSVRGELLVPGRPARLPAKRSERRGCGGLFRGRCGLIFARVKPCQEK